jgi:hypothetical protein
MPVTHQCFVFRYAPGGTKAAFTFAINTVVLMLRSFNGDAAGAAAENALAP